MSDWTAGAVVGLKSYPLLILTVVLESRAYSSITKVSGMALILIEGSWNIRKWWNLRVRATHVIPNFHRSTQCFYTSFKNSALCPPGVRTTVLWAALVCSVTKSVSVRMEPSVIISTAPVCVKLGLKALIAKRGSVPQVSMASSVTNTAPVIAPTLWGEWDVSVTHSG